MITAIQGITKSGPCRNNNFVSEFDRASSATVHAKLTIKPEQELDKTYEK